MRERHPDHVEPVERVGRVGRVCSFLAAHQLTVRPRALIPRHVDVDDALVLRIGHDRVGMRSLAGLHVLHEPRRGGIGYVVDPDPGHVILRVLHAALGAVVPVAAPLRRNEEQVPHHRRITLRGDARDGGHRLRCGGVAHVPHGEAGKVALIDVLAAEGEVGIDEGEAARRIEYRRLGRERDQPHVLRGHGGVEPARLEPAARILAAGIGLRRKKRRDEEQRCDEREHPLDNVHRRLRVGWRRLTCGATGKVSGASRRSRRSGR